jgi:hypothetical protein
MFSVFLLFSEEMRASLSDIGGWVVSSVRSCNSKLWKFFMVELIFSSPPDFEIGFRKVQATGTVAHEVRQYGWTASFLLLLHEALPPPSATTTPPNVLKHQSQP